MSQSPSPVFLLLTLLAGLSSVQISRLPALPHAILTAVPHTSRFSEISGQSYSMASNQRVVHSQCVSELWRGGSRVRLESAHIAAQRCGTCQLLLVLKVACNH